MLHDNVGLIFGGCAAVAVGALGGWTALAMRAPAPQPVEVSRHVPDQAEPTLAVETPARPTSVAPLPPTPAPDASFIRASANVSGPTGVWIDHTGRGAVEITECAGKLCGRIVWLKDAGHKSVCGTQIIGNVKSVGKGIWDGGWIHDPEKNEKYSVELKTVGADKLRVMGYMGSKLFSETFTWKRPTSDLKRCDAPATTATPAPGAAEPKPAAPTEVASPGTPPDELEKPAADKSPRGNPGMGDIEKIAREMLKGKRGGKQCTANLPYVGNVTIPCQG